MRRADLNSVSIVRSGVFLFLRVLYACVILVTSDEDALGKRLCVHISHIEKGKVVNDGEDLALPKDVRVGVSLSFFLVAKDGTPVSRARLFSSSPTLSLLS